MMGKHTPGPWIFRHGLNLVGLNGRLVANCGGHSQNFDVIANDEENNANAQLVSVAPDLLETLEEIFYAYHDLASMRACGDEMSRDPLSKKVSALIAKAKGINA